MMLKKLIYLKLDFYNTCKHVSPTGIVKFPEVRLTHLNNVVGDQFTLDLFTLQSDPNWPKRSAHNQ